MSAPRPLDHARALLARGLAPIPLPYKSKIINRKGWTKLRLTDQTLPAYFKRSRGNVGVIFGEASGWIVDVDLDHPLAVELADRFLPPTTLTWGRASKPRSHRLYRVSAPCRTRKWARKGIGMIVELRSTGSQSVGPGSTHPNGEAIRWDEDGEAALIDPDDLLRAIVALVGAVLASLDPAAAVAAAVVVVDERHNRNLTANDPTIPVDPLRPKDPLDPIRMTPESVIASARVDGPHQHDAMTMRLARGLKLNALIPSPSAARPHFDAWWAESRPHCSERDTDAAWFKFERAWEIARDPLGAPGIAATVLGMVDHLPSVPASKPFGPLLARFVDALAEMGRRTDGAPFAISARMVADAFGVSDSTAHEWMKGLERAGLLRTTDRGRKGPNGTGKARRIMVLPHVWNVPHNPEGGQ